ncbi:MAG: hypothetical protein JST93_26385 [Acidobacteria bacterium]|nr:hypothetical protein [Acidobacteriota bacterium]
MITRYATVVIALAVIAALLLVPLGEGTQPLDRLKVSVGYVLLFLLLVLGLQICIYVATGKINLEFLICDSAGYASMGRFQLLVFTFVVALSFFLVVLDKKALPDVPASVLTLLGISASTFAVSKSVDASEKADEEKPKPKDDANGKKEQP